MASSSELQKGVVLLGVPRIGVRCEPPCCNVLALFTCASVSVLWCCPVVEPTGRRRGPTGKFFLAVGGRRVGLVASYALVSPFLPLLPAPHTLPSGWSDQRRPVLPRYLSAHISGGEHRPNFPIWE